MRDHSCEFTLKGREGRVFSRDVVLGGKLLLWGEKCEEYPKNERNLLLFGGEIPPKGPEKKKKKKYCMKGAAVCQLNYLQLHEKWIVS